MSDNAVSIPFPFSFPKCTIMSKRVLSREKPFISFITKSIAPSLGSELSSHLHEDFFLNGAMLKWVKLIAGGY